MVNLKSLVIWILVLNLHISWQSLKHLEKKTKQTKKTKTQSLAIILTQMYPLFRE